MYWLLKNFLLLLMLWITGIFPSVAKNTEQIILTAFHYPPYMDESQPSGGVFCELVSAAYKASGYTVTYRFYPLMRSTKYVLSGTALGQLGTEWNFPEASRNKDITPVPLFYYRVVGFYRKDRFSNIRFSSLADLSNYRLGVILGSSDAQIFKTVHNLMVEEVSQGEQMFKKVQVNRNDIGFMAELSGLSILQRDYQDQLDQWVMTEDIIQGLVAQVVFSRKYPDAEKYIEALQSGIRTIRSNGTYTRIFEKYYGKGRLPAKVSDINQKAYSIPKT